MGVAGLASIGSSLIGAGASIFGSNAQADAAQKAIQAQQQALAAGYGYAGQQAGAAAGTLNPFIAAGQGALNTYQAALPGLTKPFDASSLESTPGYQFTLGQGLKATQNSYAAQGLGSSGAALRGAGAFTTGLAQSTYNQQFQNYLQQNQQIGNLLFQPAQLQYGAGVGAAGQLAGIYGQLGAAGLGASVGTGQGIAGSNIQQGNALAGGAAGVSNALTGGINNALLYNYLGGAGTTSLGGYNSPFSGAAWGGGSLFGGDAWGGSSTSPLPGLTAADYGVGF